MNKQELAEEIKDVDTSKAKAVRMIDRVFEEIAVALSRGKDVTIHGFGTFKAAKRAARKGVNPATGESINIPEKTAVKFTPAKALKDAVN